MPTQLQSSQRRQKLREEIAAVQPPVPQSWWDKTKAFFHYSVTILVARATVISGLLVGAVGAMDWSPLQGISFDTGFSKHQVIWLGSIALIQGVGVELARRRTL